MEKLPHFQAFDEYIVKGINQIWEACKKGRWISLALYFLVCIAILATFLFGLIAIIGNGWQFVAPLFAKPKPSYAPKELTYLKKTETRDTDGLYNTTYDIRLHTPAGNNIQTHAIFNNIGVKEAECQVGYTGRELEANGGLASSTDFYFVSCRTRIPILDNGSLFSVIQ